MPSSNYRKMYVRFGTVDGFNVPPNQTLYLRLAPEDIPAAVVSFADNTGHKDSWYGSGQIYDVQAMSDGALFFGFGASGMAAGLLASKLDHMLAPWEMLFQGPNMNLCVYAHHGPPPLTAEWARVQHRLQLRSMSDLTEGEQALMQQFAQRR